MSNTVEIVVTSTHRGAPALKAAQRDLDDTGRVALKAGAAVATSATRIADASRTIEKASNDTARTVVEDSDAVTAAQLRVLRASEAQAEAFTAVTRASDQLEFERIGGDAAKMAAAGKALDKALADLDKRQRDVASSGNMLSRALKEQASAAESSAAESGRKLGDRLGAAASESAALRMGGAAQVIIPVMSQVGAAAGGALVLGMGAGLATLGIMAAKNAEHVQDEYIGMSSRIAERAQFISRPWQHELLVISRTAESTWDQMESQLASATGRMAPATSAFAKDVGRALLQLGPALDPLSRAAAAVMRDLGGRLPGVLSGLSRELQTLASAVEENPEALGQMVELLGQVAEMAIAAATGFTIVNGKITEYAEKLNLDVWSMFGEDQLGVQEQLDQTGASTDDLGAKTEALEKRQKEAAKAAQDQQRALEGLQEQLDASISTNIALREAELAAKDSVVAYNEAVAEHGRKSREATDAQLAAEEAAYRLATAVRDSSLAQQQASGSGQDLAAANYQAEQKLRQLASTASGPVRDALLKQADAVAALVNQLRNINPVYTTKVRIVQEGRVPSGPWAYAGGAMASNAHGGIVGMAAAGGIRGRRTLVGEGGPEIVDLPPGSRVHPAGETQRMLEGAGGGGQAAAVPVYLPMSESDVGRVLLDIVERAAQRQGYRLALVPR